MKQTVVFDFDGVIHSYKSGWQGVTIIPDEPVEGIKEAIAEIRAAGYEVVVVSTRCDLYEGQVAIQQYLEKHGIKVDRICKEKPPAIVYIDDRALCFDGNAGSLLEKIRNFQPWNKTDKKITNFDRIREMSIDEMARVIFNADAIDDDIYCHKPFTHECNALIEEGKDNLIVEMCVGCVKKWLESEVESDA